MVATPLRQNPTTNNPDFDERLTAEHSSTTDDCSSGSVFSEDTSPELSRVSSMCSDNPSDFAKETDRFDQLRDIGNRDSVYGSLDLPAQPQTKTSSLLPNSRPFSTPDPAALTQPHLAVPQPIRPDRPPDRSSTSSLPLPTHTPYHSLPAIPPTTLEEGADSTRNAEAGPSTYRPPPMTRGARTEPITRSDPAPFYRTPSMPFDPFDPSLDSSFDLPPPEPPTILTSPSPTEPRSGPAPHEPFLSHAPAPEDAWATIETRPTEYRLVVRLPGFNRQSM